MWSCVYFLTPRFSNMVTEWGKPIFFVLFQCSPLFFCVVPGVTFFVLCTRYYHTTTIISARKHYSGEGFLFLIDVQVYCPVSPSQSLSCDFVLCLSLSLSFFFLLFSWRDLDRLFSKDPFRLEWCIYDFLQHGIISCAFIVFYLLVTAVSGL